MKIYSKRLVSIVLTVMMLASVMSINLFVTPASAVYYKPGDIITFGSYPQTRVTDHNIIFALDARMSPIDSPVTYLGSKYKKVYFTQYTPYNSRLEPSAENSWQDDNGYYTNTSYWFKYEPVKWRVLSNSFTGLFVVSEKILDAKPYNSKYGEVTWETCSMRPWLNNDFCKEAFTRMDMARIQTSTVINEDNPFYGTKGGNDTKDRLFLLSFKEVTNKDYGFGTSTSTTEETRKASGTDYAKCAGVYVDRIAGAFSGNSYWWLRSPGSEASRAGYIHYMPIDMIGAFYYGSEVDYNSIGVRPALKLRGLTILCASDNPGFIADSVNSVIYGIDPGTTKAFFESGMLLDSGTMLKYTPDNGALGTGTTVSLIDTGTNEVLETYTVVVFGDVNGDGNIDSNDAGVLFEVENYAVAWDPVADAAFIKAADVNGDGNVDGNDAGIIVEIENYNLTLDQVTGLAS